MLGFVFSFHSIVDASQPESHENHEKSNIMTTLKIMTDIRVPAGCFPCLP